MFTLSDDLKLLQDAARGFVQDKMPTTHLRAVREKGGGFDRTLWAEMAALGWTGICVPEEFGGAGMGCRGMGLVLEECGRTLAPSPLLSTALVGAIALIDGGSADLKKAWLPKLAEGKTIIALAVDEGPHHDPARTALALDKGALNGRKTYVADGDAADLLVVVIRRSGRAGDAKGLGLALVDATAVGVERRTLQTVDSRGAADITFRGVKPIAELAPADGDHDRLVSLVLDVARIGLAAEMLGAATQSFEITADYLKTRTQFGQLIGSFQSLQHRAAKMLVEIEMTRSSIIAALDALDRNAKDIPAWASLAKGRASETVHLVSNEMVQMHGGIGMTDAHDSGLYMKRARVTEALYGGAAFHRDRYATLQGF